MRKTSKFLLVAMAALLASPAVAQQPQQWPSKMIRWIVPYAPGGPADVIARIVGEKLSARLGQTVLIDNKPGASGDIGANEVIRSPADGYTMLYVNPFIVTNPLTMKASKDLTSQLKPAVLMTTVPMVLIRNPKFEAKSFADVLAAIRSKPGQVTCGSSGAMPLVACYLLKTEANADIISVVYRGQAPVMTAVMGGEINLAFDMSNTVTPYIDDQKVFPIATTAAKREDARTTVPAISESVPDFELIVWQGAMVAKDTPDEIVTRINQEINAVLAMPEVRQRVLGMGLTIAGGKPEDFGALIARDKVRFQEMFKKANIEPQ